MSERSSEKNQEHYALVYGTLRTGASNAFRMKGAVSLGEATLNARLYRVHEEFPGITLSDDPADIIIGEVFSKISPEMLHQLDVYEGCDEAMPKEKRLYRRVQVKAHSEAGEIRCWVWEYVKPLEEKNRILSGDWLNQ